MTRKILVIAALLVCMLSVVPIQVAHAIQTGDYISLNWAPWNYGASGGEFTVYNYSTKSVEFTTFCLEPKEYFYPGEKILVQSMGTMIMYNGGTTAVPLNSLTAYLYHEFAHNSWNVEGIFNYGDAAIRKADDALLQSAIWYFQYGGSAGSNKFIDYANRYVELDGWSGTGDVAVMNLFGSDGSRKQDQLALVPEPMTLLLLGTGLIGVAAFRRKIK